MEIIFSSFFAGMLSFLSPCIISLVPMYAGFLSGMTDPTEKSNRKRLFLGGLSFLAGLMLVYVILGASATALGKYLFKNSILLKNIGAVIIIFFGIFQMGIINPSFLTKESKFRFKGKSGKLSSAFLLGMAFSFGWTPCTGPILAVILGYAANQATVLKGVGLLTIYSVGFSIPFLLSLFLIEPIMRFTGKSQKTFKIIKIITGLLIIAIGILMLTNKMHILIPRT